LVVVAVDAERAGVIREIIVVDLRVGQSAGESNRRLMIAGRVDIERVVFDVDVVVSVAGVVEEYPAVVEGHAGDGDVVAGDMDEFSPGAVPAKGGSVAGQRDVGNVDAVREVVDPAGEVDGSAIARGLDGAQHGGAIILSIIGSRAEVGDVDG